MKKNWKYNLCWLILMVAGFILTMMTYSDEKAGFAPKEKKAEEKAETAPATA